MDCRDIEQLLSVKQAAELTSEQRVAVADHMWQCATCRMRWNLDVTNADSQADAPSDHGPEGAIVRRRGEDEEQSTSIDGEVGPPRNLGGFEILGRLGRGGMATVFRVRQRSMDRIVALKVLMGHTGWSEASLMRFTREAQTAAAAGHPNIIEVYDTGHDRGWYYIAMEYMDGGSLADVLQRDGPLAPERALALMKQVAGGLAEAHRMGILHRDIKPSNILLTSRGWAKVADFGLAKRPDIDLSVTRSALLLGTPVYMAPEALRGAEYDARCDLYSLGATFYQTLAGQPPFMGRTSTELVAKHLEAQPAPLTEVSPGTPPPLARIVHRLLEKKPSDRYQSAGDLLSALEGVSLPAASDSGSAASGTTAFGRIGRGVGLKPRTLLLVALLSLVVIAALVGLFVWPGGESHLPGPWVRMFDGETLAGWRVVEEGDCFGHGEVRVENGWMVLEQADPDNSTSVSWTGFVLPRTNYELKLEAMRTAGTGCLFHLAFPVGDSHCLLLVGGDGTRVALDQVDGKGPKENGTARFMTFEDDRSYRILLRVTPANIKVWIDDRPIIDLSLAREKVDIPAEWTILQPLGLGNWKSASAFRKIFIRRLEPAK